MFFHENLLGLSISQHTYIPTKYGELLCFSALSAVSISIPCCLVFSVVVGFQGRD